MSAHDVTITKIQQLPESLVQEVGDFIDFLMMKHNRVRWQLWIYFADYLSNLEDYEERLARGEIRSVISSGTRGQVTVYPRSGCGSSTSGSLYRLSIA